MDNFTTSQVYPLTEFNFIPFLFLNELIDWHMDGKYYGNPDYVTMIIRKIVLVTIPANLDKRWSTKW